MDCDEPYDYKPIHFLRCHSRIKDDKADIKTRVWCCSFEPDPQVPKKTTNLVATCGATSVCVIDVNTGQVVNKYYSDDINEEFFTIAWTTLNMKQESGYCRSNVFAVAGRSSMIHLIHPENKVCFYRKSFKRVIGAASGIVSMLFHPLSVSVLFVSFSDGRILVTDIGQPSPPDYDTSPTDLMTLFTPDREIFVLSFSIQCEMLLAASDDGIFGWHLGLSEMNDAKADPKRLHFKFPAKPTLESKPQLVDSVEALNDGTMIASKCALYGEIYLWDLEKCRHSRKDKVVVIPDRIFTYSDTDNYFMAMGSHPSSGLLSCGDDEGRIWLYDLNNTQSGDDRLDACAIFPWPIVTDHAAESKKKLRQDVYDIVVNKVTVDSTGKFIVAVTSTNLVCIWQRAVSKNLV